MAISAGFGRLPEAGEFAAADQVVQHFVSLSRHDEHVRLRARSPLGKLLPDDHHGLLAETATIGTRAGWQARLRAARFELRGHRLVRFADTPSKR